MQDGNVYGDVDLSVAVGRPREEPPENTDEVEYHHVRAVELEDVGIGQVNLALPGVGGYLLPIIRQHDLRTNPPRTLDDELPDETMAGIESNWD